MGAASCFGSPIFNMCIGFGLSVACATGQSGRPFQLRPDDEVPLALAFLIGSCLMTGVAVPLMGFRFGRRYGLWLIVYYAIFMLMSLLAEGKAIEVPGPE